MKDDSDSEKQQQIHHIKNLYAFNLFCQKRFDESMQVFAKLGTGNKQVWPRASRYETSASAPATMSALCCCISPAMTGSCPSGIVSQISPCYKLPWLCDSIRRRTSLGLPEFTQSTRLPASIFSSTNHAHKRQVTDWMTLLQHNHFLSIAPPVSMVLYPLKCPVNVT